MESIVENLQLKDIDKSTWKKYRFDQIAKNISERVEPSTTDLEIYVGLEHIDSESVHIKRYGKREDVNGTKLRCYPGDVIFGRRRAYQRKAAIVEFDGFCSAHSLVLRANPEVIHPNLFPFFLHSDTFMHRAVDISVGSLSPTINWGDLKKQEFILPPIDQQEQITELLWAGDKIVSSEVRLLEKVKSFFDALSKKYFNDAAFDKISLGDSSHIIMGQSPSGDSYNSDGSGVPLINGPTEFTKKYPVKIQWTSKPTKFCQELDILICVRGSTTGRMNISDDTYCIGRGVAAIRGNGEYRTDYLEYALRYNVGEILRLATGSTFPNIDSKTLKSIMIPKVDLKLQEEIIYKLKTADQLSDNIESKLNSTKALVKSLINQIF